MFSSPTNPIAISFGSSSAKLLQIGTGDKHELVAAAELPLSDAAQQSQDELIAFYEQNLPKLMRQAGFKGKRVVCSIPGQQTIIQHMQLSTGEGMKRDDLVKSQLQMQMGIAPGSAVVRAVDVAELNRAGQVRSEVICFAIPRDAVMRYVTLLEKFKLEVVGVHTETMAMVRAFDHIHKRKGDEDTTTMYIDLGWSGTRVAIAHGTKLVFARSIQIGGRHFDQLIANELECDLSQARAHRLSMTADQIIRPQNAASAGTSAHSAARTAVLAGNAEGESLASGDGQITVSAGERRNEGVPAALPVEVSSEGGETPRTPANIDFSELLDTITDELSMCLRYHHGLFPNRPLDRAILVGGEARQMWLCQHIVRAVRLPARLGDPLAGLAKEPSSIKTPNLDRTKPQPGWAVACGLAVMPSHG